MSSASTAPLTETEVARKGEWFASLPVAAMLAVDCTVVSLLAGASVAFWRALGHPMNFAAYARLWPALLLFTWAYAAGGLYRAIPLAPVEELRSIIVSTGSVFLVLIGGTFLLKDSAAYSRGAALICCSAITFSLPVVRSTIRRRLGAARWFARPVVVMGAGHSAARIVEILRRQPALGLRPVAVFDDTGRIGYLHGVPIAGNFVAARQYVRSHGVTCAIFAAPGISRSLLKMIEEYGECFQRVIVAPDLASVSSLWVNTTDLGGTLALELRDNLLHASARFAKRMVDLMMLFSLAALAVPVVAALGILVKLTSRGPVFFTQIRYGRDGNRFRIWKFRTMVQNAEQVLQACLSNDPMKREEWAAAQKLREDPRLTLIGRFLRRTSLDELPQLWNVLRGDMSLVGPRPIVESEIAKYGPSYRLYVRVTPGITGLWQVSGRNNTTYAERIAFDEYYVRNWSPWLDIYILALTVRTVIACEGAY